MNSKIDLIQFVPKFISGHRVFVEENEGYLNIWYKHPRIKPLKLRRYVDVNILGGLLGQYQAEGTKNSKRKLRLEFTNTNILEHKEFAEGLMHIGIPKDDMVFELFHKPDIFTKELIKHFQTQVGPVSVIQKSPHMKGNYGFRTYVRKIILIEIFFNVLAFLRQQMSKQKCKLSNRFFAKLLTGDGTLDIRIKNRSYGYPAVRIKITDRNLNYLKDYAGIMATLGFKPHILEKHISVRASCSLNNLLYLYKIRAFENTNNWYKLLVVIALCLEGRRYNTHYRFIELSKLSSFTSKEFMKIFEIKKLRTANDWLNNKKNEGLLVKLQNKPYCPVLWQVTDKAKSFVEVLLRWRNEFQILNESKNFKDLHVTLDSLKVKKKV